MMRELRCHGCRKLICYEYIFDGRIEFQCPRCSFNNIFNFKHRKNATVKKVDVKQG